VVLLAIYQGTEVVLKASRSSSESMQSRALPTMAEELRIFRRLRHPNIVLFYGACVDPASSEIILVLEYVRGKCLNEAIKGVSSNKAEVVRRCGLANDICCALAYLHSQTPAIIHGDIKDSNILVEQFSIGCRARLLDFGLSRLLTPRARYLGGTLKWMAPEVFSQQTDSIAPAADVFSFGRVLYTIMTGCSPLFDIKPEKVIALARVGSCPALVWPEHMPFLDKEVRELTERSTQSSPASRPSIGQAQQALQAWKVEDEHAGGARLLSDILAQQPGLTQDLHVALELVRGGAVNSLQSSEDMAESLQIHLPPGSSSRISCIWENDTVDGATAHPEDTSRVSL